jgi:hypothetical protein
MRRTTVVLAVVCATVVMQTRAAAQVGIGAKIGSTGVGGEVSYGIKQRFALRASVTAIPLEPELELSERNYKIEPPSPLVTLGADYMLGYNFRVRHSDWG